MAGAVGSPYPTEQGINLINLVSLLAQSLTVLNNPLAGKPVVTSKVQKLNHLLGTGQGTSSPAGRELISLAC